MGLLRNGKNQQGINCGDHGGGIVVYRRAIRVLANVVLCGAVLAPGISEAGLVGGRQPLQNEIVIDIGNAPNAAGALPDKLLSNSLGNGVELLPLVTSYSLPIAYEESSKTKKNPGDARRNPYDSKVFSDGFEHGVFVSLWILFCFVGGAAIGYLGGMIALRE